MQAFFDFFPASAPSCSIHLINNGLQRGNAKCSCASRALGGLDERDIFGEDCGRCLTRCSQFVAGDGQCGGNSGRPDRASC